MNTMLIGAVLTEGYAAACLDDTVQCALMRPDSLTGRPGRAEDVADAFLWLASPSGSRVSGQIIQVTGCGKRVRLFPE